MSSEWRPWEYTITVALKRKSSIITTEITTRFEYSATALVCRKNRKCCSLFLLTEKVEKIWINSLFTWNLAKTSHSATIISQVTIQRTGRMKSATVIKPIDRRRFWKSRWPLKLIRRQDTNSSDNRDNNCWKCSLA
jgi:hypothetical protein